MNEKQKRLSDAMGELWKAFKPYIGVDGSINWNEFQAAHDKIMGKYINEHDPLSEFMRVYIRAFALYVEELDVERRAVNNLVGVVTR